MIKSFIAPSRYVQGENALEQIGGYIKIYGGNALIVANKQDFERVKAEIETSARASGVRFSVADFGGECSYDEINRIKKSAEGKDYSVFVGLGGGKAIDACKVIANGKPLIICPTIASTDAPTSHVSVVYTPDGNVQAVEFIKQNPEVVLVDTAVIARAPVRLLVSGMGDALATYFEARACGASDSSVVAGGRSTIAGEVLSRTCYEVLMEDGLQAKYACENKVVTPALENIIEANTLLSGLGFECGGLAAAHAIHDALTVLPETHKMWHGEKVAFGVLTQLILENADSDEIDDVLNFCLSVGLPVCLEDLGIKELDDAALKKVGELACFENSFIHNMPFVVTPDMVVAAIKVADQTGRKAKENA